MKVWRMAFRMGEGGPEMWEACLRFGVAAITYRELVDIDLSKYPQGEPRSSWMQLSSAQKYSLRMVAYEMAKGDVIYVKKGKEIVGKGIIKGSYQFDTKKRIIDPQGTPWTHQVPVAWASDFVPIKISLGDQQRYTVREISRDALPQVEQHVKEALRRTAIEGQVYKRETVFRKRNAALIQAKKTNSDYCCEVCGFNFEEVYGNIGQGYIIAHHIKPMASKSTPSRTKIEDIALLCANCHVMVHTANPPI
jgi:predicted HNH restriction endonuclease